MVPVDDADGGAAMGGPAGGPAMLVSGSSEAGPGHSWPDCLLIM